MLQARDLGEADYRGERLRASSREVKGDHELLNLSRPDVVEAAHREYLAAGADIIETNTFNGTRISQADYGAEALAYDINLAAARAARRAADAVMAEEPGRVRWVAGALGPTNKTASLSRDVNDPGARARHVRRAGGRLPRAGARAAGRRRRPAAGRDRVRHAQREGRALRGRAGLRGARARGVPVMASVTITDRARTQPLGPDRRGVLDLGVARAAAVGRHQLRARARRRCGRTSRSCRGSRRCFVSAYPNAGLPNAFGGFDETPESMAASLGEWARAGLAEHRGRLLRHDARPHPRDRRGGARRARRASAPGSPAPDALRGPRAAGDPAGLELRQRRRAHQRHRLAEVRRSWCARASTRRRSTSPASRSRAGRRSST